MKDAKARTIKPVSFAHDDYEVELLAYATDPARGKFGPYVKRLIERDRDGWVRTVSVSPVIVEAVPADDRDKKTAKGYL